MATEAISSWCIPQTVGAHQKHWRGKARNINWMNFFSGLTWLTRFLNISEYFLCYKCDVLVWSSVSLSDIFLLLLLLLFDICTVTHQSSLYIELFFSFLFFLFFFVWKVKETPASEDTTKSQTQLSKRPVQRSPAHLSRFTADYTSIFANSIRR